jgi:hypothetical protein
MSRLPVSSTLAAALGTSEQEPINNGRRALIGGAIATLLASRVALADDQNAVPNVQVLDDDQNAVPNDPFILLLRGLYQPVPAGQGPNLGLTTVNLNDGTYAVTQIFPIFVGIPDSKNQRKVIGNFYVSLTTGLCAYDLPGGAIAMQFTSVSPLMLLPDGTGGQFDEGTQELTIVEATGIYKAFQGGHNHMVDRLHQLTAGPPFGGFPSSGYDEFCFCIISQYPFP